MAGKPMLEFTNFPPRAEVRPKIRRRAVKTPKILKVRCVSIASHRGKHPTGLTESQIRNAELEIAKGAKWVSPQFTHDPEGFKKGRRQRPLDFGEQLFSNLKPSRTCQRRKLNLSLRKGKEGCARTRIWKRCGVVSTSQHVSLFPSASSLPIATEQQSSPVSAVPNPPPPHLVDCHVPSLIANVHSAGSTSDNTDDLHNRAFERGSHSTDSRDAPVQSTAAEDPVPLETSSDTTYLMDECCSLNGNVLKTAEDCLGRCNIMDECRMPKNNAAHSEVESHNCHGDTKHTSDENCTEEDSPSILQAPQQTSEPCFLTRLTTSGIQSPIGMRQSFVNGEFGTRHDTDLGKRSSCVHVPSLPLTPLAPEVSNPKAIESWLNVGSIQNANYHQHDTPGLSCVVNQNGVRSSFMLHNRDDLVANMSAGSYQENSNDSMHRSESPVTMHDSVDLPTLEYREIKRKSSSVIGLLYEACHTSESSLFQHHQNSRASSPLAQGVDDNCQGVRDVIQDSVDSTKLPSLILEENQSMNVSARDRDLSISEKDTQTVCDLQSFQPPSFSTPFKSTAESSDTSGAHFNLRLNQTGWKSRRHEKGNDDDVTDNSPTRLDSHWTLNHSTAIPSNVPTKVGDATSSRKPTALPAGSTHKSILKKISGNAAMLLDSCGGQSASGQHLTGKGISKSVTFNLSFNSSCSDDEISVLAEDTPRHLWCSIGSLPPSHCEDEESSVLAEDTPRHLWCSIGSLPPSHCEDEIEGVMASEDVCTSGGHREVVEENVVCENHNNWHCHCCLDDMCILAMDTPVHMWASPSINFIDDTFNHF